MLFKRSRRELSIDVAEQRSILKNYLNMYYSLFIFRLKTFKNFLKPVLHFPCVIILETVGGNTLSVITGVFRHLIFLMRVHGEKSLVGAPNNFC